MAAFSSASSAYIRFSFTSLRLEFLQPLAAPHLPGSPGNDWRNVSRGDLGRRLRGAGLEPSTSHEWPLTVAVGS